MYKLNNVCVINAKKIKIGKDTFNCEINNKAVVYIARMSESNKDVKIVFDEYSIVKTGSGFSIVLTSDSIDAVVFNKKTQQIKHSEILEVLVNTKTFYNTGESKMRDLLCKTYIDFAAAVEQSNFVIVYNDEATDNFVRRYIAIMKPILAEKAPVVMDRLPNLIIPYLDKLDAVEKVMTETSPANLAYQLETRMFDANISVNTIPLPLLQKLTKANVGEAGIKSVEKYIASGKGTIEEVNLLFRWATALKKLFEKTTGYHTIDQAVYTVIELLEYNLTITEIMTKVTNCVMHNASIIHTPGNAVLDALADIMAYRKVNGINDTTIPDDILAELSRLEDEYNIENRHIGEPFALVAQENNMNYANIIDGIGFICPDHIRDLKSYKDRVNPVSKKNLELFMEKKIIIFTIGNEYGKMFGSPIFFFDEADNIITISGTLDAKQEAAAKKLLTKIKERKA
jgi:hypothetical protein